MRVFFKKIFIYHLSYRSIDNRKSFDAENISIQYSHEQSVPLYELRHAIYDEFRYSSDHGIILPRKT